MKSSIQMRVAKHMIAVWTDVKDEASLQDAFATIDTCWPNLSRRTLRVWAKALHKNPERYEFTGFAFKSFSLLDHFTDEEAGRILVLVRETAKEGSDFEDVIRSIIHHKWVYGMSTEDAIKIGIDTYYGRHTRRYRPAKPVLKPIK